MRMKKIIGAIFAVLLFAIPAAAQDWKERFEKNHVAALQGDARAQHLVGHSYRHGLGVEKNYSQAVYWFEKAANQEHIDSQLQLGHMHKYGQNEYEQPDYQKALRWYRRAVKNGNAEAQDSLGDMYENGIGVLQNYDEAIKLYRKSALQGFSRGQVSLASMYEKGKGNDPDLVAAHAWFNIATLNSANINPGGISQQLYERMRNSVENKLSHDDIKTAQSLARKCLESNYRDCP